MASLIIIIAMFVLLWALLIRPQKAKQQRQRQMLDEIDPGDEILTVGGIYGIVVEVEDDEDIVIEIADGIHVRAARRAVAAVVKPEDEEDGEDADEVVDEPAEVADAEVVDEHGLVTVPDDEASIEATQKRLADD